MGIFSKAAKVFAILDPCSQILRFGVDFFKLWTHEIQIMRELFGEEKEILTGQKIDFFGTVHEVKIRYMLSNDERSVLLNIQAVLCQSGNECLIEIDVIKDLVLPVPRCSENGEQIIWPKINLKDFFAQKTVVKSLKKLKTSVLENSKDMILQLIEDKLQLPSVSSMMCVRQNTQMAHGLISLSR